MMNHEYLGGGDVVSGPTGDSIHVYWVDLNDIQSYCGPTLWLVHKMFKIK